MKSSNENLINSTNNSNRNTRNDDKDSYSNNNIMQYLNVLEAKNMKKGKRRMSIRQKRLDEENQKKTNDDNISLVDINQELNSNKSTSIYERTRLNVKYVDVIIGILAFSNIVITIIDNELYIIKNDEYYDNRNEFITPQNIKIMGERKISNKENICRIINIFIAFFTLIFVIIRYSLILKLLKLENKLSKYDNLISSGLLWREILEILFVIILYPPFLNNIIKGTMLDLYFVYNINSIVAAIVILKCYLIIRVYSYFSKWTSDEAISLCNKYNVESGLSFALKAELTYRPYIAIFLVTLVIVLICAYFVKIAEYGIMEYDTLTKNLSEENDLAYLLNCIWLIIITMVTVGYGDEYPKSHFGRVVIIIAAILGMLLVSIIIVSLGNLIEFTDEEKKAYSLLKKMKADDNAFNKAGNVIGILCKMRYLFERRITGNNIKKNSNIIKYNTNHNNNSKKTILIKRFILLTKLKRAVSMFKSDFKLATSFSIPVDEMLKFLESKLSSDIKELNSKLDILQTTEGKLDKIETVQKNISDSMEPILKRQEKIAKYIIEINNQLYMNNILKRKQQKYKKKKSTNILSKFKIDDKDLSLDKEDIKKEEKKEEKKNESIEIQNQINIKVSPIISNRKKNDDIDFIDNLDK